MKEKIMRYSESYRRMVVSEYEAGSSILGLQKKYAKEGFLSLLTNKIQILINL